MLGSIKIEGKKNERFFLFPETSFPPLELLLFKLVQQLMYIENLIDIDLISLKSGVKTVFIHLLCHMD